MKFTSNNEEKVVFFEDLDCGEYFRRFDSFYIKTDKYDDDGDYYAIDLYTGEAFTFCDERVIRVNIKEIIYEDV